MNYKYKVEINRKQNKGALNGTKAYIRNEKYFQRILWK